MCVGGPKRILCVISRDKFDAIMFPPGYLYTLQVLAFYSGTSEREKRGEIPIDGQCRVEIIPDSTSKSPLKTPGSKHHSKFQLFASQKTYEFQANDHRTRLQWVNAFKVAIENAEEPVRYQRSLLDKRKLARQEEKEREEEEDNRKASHADSLDQTKIQLEQEKQVLMHDKQY